MTSDWIENTGTIPEGVEVVEVRHRDGVETEVCGYGIPKSCWHLTDSVDYITHYKIREDSRKEITVKVQNGLQYKIKGSTIHLEMIGDLCSISVTDGEVEVVK